MPNQLNHSSGTNMSRRRIVSANQQTPTLQHQADSAESAKKSSLFQSNTIPLHAPEKFINAIQALLSNLFSGEDAPQTRQDAPQTIQSAIHIIDVLLYKEFQSTYDPNIFTTKQNTIKQNTKAFKKTITDTVPDVKNGTASEAPKDKWNRMLLQNLCKVNDMPNPNHQVRKFVVETFITTAKSTNSNDYLMNRFNDDRVISAYLNLNDENKTPEEEEVKLFNYLVTNSSYKKILKAEEILPFETALLQMLNGSQQVPHNYINTTMSYKYYLIHTDNVSFSQQLLAFVSREETALSAITAQQKQLDQDKRDFCQPITILIRSLMLEQIQKKYDEGTYQAAKTIINYCNNNGKNVTDNEEIDYDKYAASFLVGYDALQQKAAHNFEKTVEALAKIGITL
jgi:hypothetical protein